MPRGRKTINSSTAILIIIACSLLFGFLLLQNTNPLADTAEQGVDTFQKLDALNQELETYDE